jgi:hypothetical protein
MSIDGFFRPRETDTLLIHYVRSDTLYPSAVAKEFGQPEGEFSDDFWEVRYQFSNRNWYFAVDYEDYGTDFRTDSGFVPRVGILKAQSVGSRNFWGDEDTWYDQWVVGYYVNRTEDQEGLLTDEIYQVYGSVAGPLQSVVDLSTMQRKEYFSGILYEGLDWTQLALQIQPTGSLRLSLSGSLGDTIDYANNQLADETVISPSLEAKIGKHINASFDHTLQRLDVPGGELFEANLSQLKLVYNFSSRMFVRGILQRLDIERDPDLYTFETEPELETLFSQFLFSYKLNARTVLFAGYSDNQLGLQNIRTTRTDRTLFFKIGYAWIL